MRCQKYKPDQKMAGKDNARLSGYVCINKQHEHTEQVCRVEQVRAKDLTST